MQRLRAVFLTLILVFLVSGCGEDKRPQSLKLGGEVEIPSGYELIGVAQYGQIEGVTTVYCRNTSSGRTFVCKNGKTVREIFVPEGYELVDVSAYGKIAGVYTFYCQNVTTKKYYTCNPK